MNSLLRSSIVATSVTLCCNGITILQKNIDLGKNPTTNKQMIATVYAFDAADNACEKPDTQWYSVVPFEKDLFFLSVQNNQNDCFPVSSLISQPASFIVDVDPEVQKSGEINGNSLKPATDTTFAHKPSKVTMNVSLSNDVKLFKDLLIILARNDAKILKAFVARHSIEKIESIIRNALDCQGTCLIVCDDQKALDDILQNIGSIAEPIQLKGSLIFIPMDKLIEALLEQQSQKDDQHDEAHA